jgi:hypothetical protein
MCVPFFSATSVRNIFSSDKYLELRENYAQYARRKACVAKCPLLLSDFNQTWSISTNVSINSQCNISRKTDQRFSSCRYMRTDRHDIGKANRRIVATSLRSHQTNKAFVSNVSSIRTPGRQNIQHHRNTLEHGFQIIRVLAVFMFVLYFTNMHK